ncbi:MAG: ribosomal RNA small subunit methyltransferase A [Bacilli bacterium]|nr:ribosomal RNA small subunit methyltransferase A [Bacilli bacterium]
MKYSPVEANKILKEHEFNFKKKFGQNFIVDENIIDNIIKKTDIKEDSLVIEVGPGSGALTYKLCAKANRVLCFEIDKTLEKILKNNLREFNNVDIVFEDFLQVDLKKELKKYNYKHLYLVANLPYYITTPIITKVIEQDIDIDKMVVMVQKEVGERFSAKVNTKHYNSLSVFLQYHFDIHKIMDVSRNVFVPKPNVDSEVVEFVKKEKIKTNNLDKFYSLVKDSFNQKRKNLRNNLKSYDLEKIELILKKYGYDLTARAEQLSIDIFIDISNNL